MKLSELFKPFDDANFCVLSTNGVITLGALDTVMRDHGFRWCLAKINARTATFLPSKDAVKAGFYIDEITADGYYLRLIQQGCSEEDGIEVDLQVASNPGFYCEGYIEEYDNDEDLPSILEPLLLSNESIWRELDRD